MHTSGITNSLLTIIFRLIFTLFPFIFTPTDLVKSFFILPDTASPENPDMLATPSVSRHATADIDYGDRKSVV